MNSTVRTLRYYDEINLLKPSYISESGYRYYSKKRYYHITANYCIKGTKFSIKSNRNNLKSEKWEDVFEEQLALVTKELRLFKHLSVIEQNDSWKNIFQYIRQRVF